MLDSKAANTFKKGVYENDLGGGAWGAAAAGVESCSLPVKVHGATFGHYTFSGGFYTARRRNGSGLRIIGLNTMLWFRKNPVVANISDPGGQFQWLETQLEKLRGERGKGEHRS